jgi:hypothetical protein
VNETIGVAIPAGKAGTRATVASRSSFYRIIAIALGVTVLVGFARTFYLRFAFEQLPPMDLLLWVHGITFTAWMALFIVQTRFIAANNVRAHRRFGFAGIFVAMLVVGFGLATAIYSADAPRVRGGGLPSYQFVFVPIFILIVFSALFTAAVLLRKRADLHKRLMVLAMISLLGPATARILRIFDDGSHFLIWQTAVTAAFVAWCLVSDWIKSRTVHPVYAIGGVLLVMSWPFRLWFAQTPAWSPIGKWLAAL